jgi:hypothetical protein
MKLTELLTENSVIRDYMSSPSDPADGNNIRLTLERKLTGNTAWYRLETDGWFRRYWSPGKGYGVMLRGIKIKESPRWERFQAFFPMTCFYLPNQFDHPEDDIKANWEHSYGFIVMDKKIYEPFMHESSIKELESFINGNTRKYKP